MYDNKKQYLLKGCHTYLQPTMENSNVWNQIKKLSICKGPGKHDLWSGIKIITINRNNPEMVRMME